MSKNSSETDKKVQIGEYEAIEYLMKAYIYLVSNKSQCNLDDSDMFDLRKNKQIIDKFLIKINFTIHKDLLKSYLEIYTDIYNEDFFKSLYEFESGTGKFELTKMLIKNCKSLSSDYLKLIIEKNNIELVEYYLDNYITYNKDSNKKYFGRNLLRLQTKTELFFIELLKYDDMPYNLFSYLFCNYISMNNDNHNHLGHIGFKPDMEEKLDKYFKDGFKYFTTSNEIEVSLVNETHKQKIDRLLRELQKVITEEKQVDKEEQDDKEKSSD